MKNKARERDEDKDLLEGLLPEETDATVYVSCGYISETGGERRPGEDEDDPYASREPIERTHGVFGVFLEESNKQGWNKYHAEVNVLFTPVTGDTVFLVLVIHSDGDTFGSSHGNIAIVGVFATSDEADKVATAIRAGTDGDEYAAWKGYFANLEDIEVHRLQLDEVGTVRKF